MNSLLVGTPAGGGVNRGWDASEFYDVFDAVNLFGDSELSVGELAGSLEVFFWGTVQQRVTAVFELLGGQAMGKELNPDALAAYCKPFVWASVPQTAASLRPILLELVVKDLFEEVDVDKSRHVGLSELIKWHELRHGNNVADRSAEKVDGIVYAEWLKMEEKSHMLAHGNKTYEQQYGAVPVWKKMGQVSPVTHSMPVGQSGAVYQAIQQSAPVAYLAGIFGGQAGEVSPRSRTLSVVTTSAPGGSITTPSDGSGSAVLTRTSMTLPAPPFPAGAAQYQYDPNVRKTSIFTALAADSAAQPFNPAGLPPPPQLVTRKSVTFSTANTPRVEQATVQPTVGQAQPSNGVVWHPKNFQPLQIPGLAPGMMQAPTQQLLHGPVQPPSMQYNINSGFHYPTPAPSAAMPTQQMMQQQMAMPTVQLRPGGPPGSYHMPAGGQAGFIPSTYQMPMGAPPGSQFMPRAQ